MQIKGLLISGAMVVFISSCAPEEDAQVKQIPVTGVVADGYLVGAKVCLDKNENRQCDADEPQATTTAGGVYTFNADEGTQSSYPIVVVADEFTIDEDTNEAIGKKLVMSAPAGKPAFVSPLTTIVQAKLELNPSLSVAEAEGEVLESMGVTDSDASLFEDYVSDDSETSEILHVTAQIVAAAIAETLENVETLVDNNTLDATPDQIMLLVVDQVSDNLEGITSTAEKLVDEADSENPITKDDISAAVDDQVETIISAEEATSDIAVNDTAASSEESSLYNWYLSEGGRGIGIWGQSDNSLKSKIWVGTLNTETAYMSWVDSEFDSVSKTYEEVEGFAFENKVGIISESGEWITVRESNEALSRTIFDNGDDSVTWNQTGLAEDDSEHVYASFKLTGLSTDMAGRNMREFLLGYNYINEQTQGLISENAVFPAGSSFMSVTGKFEDESFWHLPSWDTCDGEEKVQLEAANAPAPLNCNRLNMIGLSMGDAEYKSYLGDYFKQVAFAPSTDPFEDENRVDVEDTRLAYIGNLHGMPYTRIKGDGTFETKSSNLLIELLGDPSTEDSGTVNYYSKSGPYVARNKGSDWCAPTGDSPNSDIYSITQGESCHILTFAEKETDGDYADKVPASFVALLTSTAVLNAMESDVDLISKSNKLVELDTEITVNGVSEIQLMGEFIGTSGDVEGEVALYYSTETDGIVRYGDGDGGIVDNATWKIHTVGNQEVITVVYPEGLDVEDEDTSYAEGSSYLKLMKIANKAKIEKLSVSKTWTKSTIRGKDIISWPAPGFEGEDVYGLAMAVDGNVVRRVIHPASAEDYWLHSFKRKLLSGVMQQSIQAEVISNYDDWVLSQMQ